MDLKPFNQTCKPPFEKLLKERKMFKGFKERIEFLKVHSLKDGPAWWFAALEYGFRESNDRVDRPKTVNDFTVARYESIIDSEGAHRPVRDSTVNSSANISGLDSISGIDLSMADLSEYGDTLPPEMHWTLCRLAGNELEGEEKEKFFARLGPPPSPAIRSVAMYSMANGSSQSRTKFMDKVMSIFMDEMKEEIGTDVEDSERKSLKEMRKILKVLKDG